MNSMAIIAALGVLVIASPAFFFLGRKGGVAAGRAGELERQAAAKATAEETAKRILADAEREVETMRKSAIVTGKEEGMRLREDAEQELARYERYVRLRMSLGRRVELLRHVLADTLGAIAYSFAVRTS